MAAGNVDPAWAPTLPLTDTSSITDDRSRPENTASEQTSRTSSFDFDTFPEEPEQGRGLKRTPQILDLFSPSSCESEHHANTAQKRPPGLAQKVITDQISTQLDSNMGRAAKRRKVATIGGSHRSVGLGFGPSLASWQGSLSEVGPGSTSSYGVKVGKELSYYSIS